MAATLGSALVAAAAALLACNTAELYEPPPTVIEQLPDASRDQRAPVDGANGDATVADTSTRADASVDSSADSSAPDATSDAADASYDAHDSASDARAE